MLTPLLLTATRTSWPLHCGTGQRTSSVRMNVASLVVSVPFSCTQFHHVTHLCMPSVKTLHTCTTISKNLNSNGYSFQLMKNTKWIHEYTRAVLNTRETCYKMSSMRPILMWRQVSLLQAKCHESCWPEWSSRWVSLCWQTQCHRPSEKSSRPGVGHIVYRGWKAVLVVAAPLSHKRSPASPPHTDTHLKTHTGSTAWHQTFRLSWS